MTEQLFDSPHTICYVQPTASNHWRETVEYGNYFIYNIAIWTQQKNNILMQY